MSSQNSKTFAVIKTFRSTLLNLQTCSRHIINKLTLLARKNTAEAPAIVKLIEDYLVKVRYDLHLPVLYLVDSIAKSIKDPYAKLFSVNMLNIFRNIADQSRLDQKRIETLTKLRNTWVGVFPSALLRGIDAELSNIHQRTLEELKQEEIKVDQEIIQKKNEIRELQRKLEAVEAVYRAKAAPQKCKKALNVKKRLSDTFSDMDEKALLKRPKIDISPIIA